MKRQEKGPQKQLRKLEKGPQKQLRKQEKGSLRLIGPKSLRNPRNSSFPKQSRRFADLEEKFREK